MILPIQQVFNPLHVFGQIEHELDFMVAYISMVLTKILFISFFAFF